MESEEALGGSDVAQVTPEGRVRVVVLALKRRAGAGARVLRPSRDIVKEPRLRSDAAWQAA